jgi:hypothetical protein
VGFEAEEVVWIGDEPAAGGNDDIAAGEEGVGGAFLQFAEGFLAILGEDVRDGFTGLCLDPFVGVDELEVQKLSGEASDGGFADAHESDEGKVVDKARILILILHGAI